MTVISVYAIFFLLIFLCHPYFLFFFFNDPATTEIYTLSLHDALPISSSARSPPTGRQVPWPAPAGSCCLAYWLRSEEHTSELQSRFDLVCRLLLEKKKKINNISKLYLIYLKDV